MLGLILGKIGEQTFAQAMQMLHYDPMGYASRPIGLVLIVGGVLTLVASIYSSLRQKPDTATPAGD